MELKKKSVLFLIIITIVIQTTLPICAIHFEPNLENNLGSASIQQRGFELFLNDMTIWRNYGNEYFLGTINEGERVPAMCTWEELGGIKSWKIEFRMTDAEGNYYYTIRTPDAQKYLFAIETSPGVATLGFIELSEGAAIQDYCLWTIGNRAQGYYIRSKTGYYLTSTSKDSITLIHSSNISSVHRDYTVWIPCTSTDYQKVEAFFFNYPSCLNVGNSTTLSLEYITLTNQTPTIDVDGYDCFEFRIENSNVATITQNGVLTAISPGYTTVIIEYLPTGVKQFFELSVGQIIPNDTYYIVNKGTKQCLISPREAGEDRRVSILSWRTTDNAKWNITYNSSGYYTIQSVQNQGKIGLIDSSNNDNVLLSCLPDTYSDCTKIKILATDFGGFKMYIDDEYSSSEAFATTTTDNFLSQIRYNANDDYSDEWLFIPVTQALTLGDGLQTTTDIYIQNVNTNKYLSVSDDSNVTGIDAFSDTNGLWSLSGNANGTGEYLIRKSSSMLAVTNNNGSFVLNDIVSTNIDNKVFEISRVNVLPYEALHVIKIDGKYLAMRDDGSLYLSVANSNDDVYWRINTYSEEKQAEYFCFNNSVPTSTPVIPNFNKSITEAGYTPNVSINPTATYFHETLVSCNNDIVIFMGHGGPDKLVFDTGDGVDPYPLYHTNQKNNVTHYVNNLPDDGLSNVKMILLLGCNTGVTNLNGNNLVESFYDKGAHFVLGALDKIDNYDTNEFFRNFLNWLSIGYTIEEALNETLNTMNFSHLSTYGIYANFPIVYKGDVTQTIN